MSGHLSEASGYYGYQTVVYYISVPRELITPGANLIILATDQQISLPGRFLATSLHERARKAQV